MTKGADDLRHLVDRAAVGRGPGSPLPAVYWSEVAVRVGPLVPDRDAVIVEIFDVCIAGKKPKQFIDDRLDVQLLGRRERKTPAQIESHLVAEDRKRAGPGAVVLFGAFGENSLQKIVILAH